MMSHQKKWINLLVCANFSFLGGEPYVMESLTRELAQRNFRITLVAIYAEKNSKFLNSFSWLRRLIVLKKRKTINAQIREIKKANPDVILNSGYLPDPPATALPLGKPLLWRVISHPRWVTPLGRNRLKAARQIRKIGFLSDRIITVSDFVRKPLCDQGFAHKANTVHEGIDANALRPDSLEKKIFCKELGLSEKDLLIGIPANLTWQKRHAIALHAAAMLKKNGHDFKLLLAGGAFNKSMWDYETALKSLAKKLGLKNHARFLGFYHNKKRFIASLDIAAFPFLDEGFGMSLIEAMSCEKPVIVTRSGAFPEIITHKKEGLVVEPGNAAAFAAGLNFLLRNERQRLAMGKNGRLKVKKMFLLKRQVDSYETILRQMARRKGVISEPVLPALVRQ